MRRKLAAIIEGRQKEALAAKELIVFLESAEGKKSLAKLEKEKRIITVAERENGVNDLHYEFSAYGFTESIFGKHAIPPFLAHKLIIVDREGCISRRIISVNKFIRAIMQTHRFKSADQILPFIKEKILEK